MPAEDYSNMDTPITRGDIAILLTRIYKNLLTNPPRKHTLPHFDLSSDNSLTKFVGKGKPFNNRRYTPSLVNIEPSNAIRGRYGRIYRLRPEAYQSLKLMAKHMQQYFGQPIVIVSAYRSYNQQASISYSCKRSGRCAYE